VDALPGADTISADSARAADDFVALMCDDARLLDEEFAEIIAFNWDAPPPGTWVGDGGTPGGRRGTRTPPPSAAHDTRAAHPGPRWTLPRAPPLELTPHL